MDTDAVDRHPATNLTYARHDPAHCLAPGLFRGLKRGDRRGKTLELTYPYSTNELITFTGSTPLGPEDLLVLQGLVALAGFESDPLLPAPQGPILTELRQRLDLQGVAAGETALVVRTSKRRLLNIIGLTTGGHAMRALYSSLQHLSSVTVLVRRRHGQAPVAGSRLIWAHTVDDRTHHAGPLIVALNPRLARAIDGKPPYIRIDMGEVRALHSGPARVIHQRLCAWINPGHSRSVNACTLMRYVWPEPANKEAAKKRRQKLRETLQELSGVGWGVKQSTPNTFRITRPSTAVHRRAACGLTFPAMRTNIPPRAYVRSPGQRYKARRVK